MNNRNINHLTMINACLALTAKPEHRPVWEGQAPAAFAADLADLKTAVAETELITAQLGGALSGAADAKANAETMLENTAYLVASALRSTYKKAGNTEALGKVNFSKNYLQRLRDTQLVADTRAILALAQTAVAQPEAVARGVTPAAITALATAIATFEGLLTTPRSNLVTRNTLLRELATRVAGHLEALADLDDLILQFGGSVEGQRFVAAWQATRVIVDAGGSQSSDPEPEPTAPTPAAPTPVTA